MQKIIANINAQATVGFIIVVIVLAMAVFGRYVAIFDPEKTDLIKRLIPPVFYEGGSWQHILGTDPMGRDILSRILWGARESLWVALLSSSIAILIGVTMGLLAGFYGGIADSLLMRTVDVMISLPAVMLAILLVAIIGPKPISVAVAMGLNMWSEYAKVLRAQTLSLREEQFILSSVAIGESNINIILKHILPNLLHIIIVIFALQLGQIIIWASALSFIGLGGTSVSWGWDVAVGRTYLSSAWWCVSWPGLAIFITVLGFTLVGDWIKATLDS